MIRETSMEAFRSILPLLSDRRRQVLSVMVEARRPLCDFQIAQMLRWQINRVTPRRGELAELGLLVEDGVRPGPPSNRPVTFWKVAPPTAMLIEQVRSAVKQKRRQAVQKALGAAGQQGNLFVRAG